MKTNSKSMRRKIMIPFLAILIIIPVITITLLNIFMHIYVGNSVRKQLAHTVTTTRIIIKREVAEIIYETDSEAIEESLHSLNRILGASKTTLNTELLLFSPNGTLVYPVSSDYLFLNDEGANEIGQNLDRININESIKIKSGDYTYAVMGYRLTELPISNVPYIVFVSSYDVLNDLMLVINIVLIFVLVAGTLTGTVISLKISTKVSRPLKILSEKSREISERKEHTIDNPTDIDEIIKLNTSLDEMAKKLAAYYNAQRDFLQNASHELKSPLMSIEGYSEGIINDMINDPKKGASVIHQESKRLGRIINDLLTLSRIENQNYKDEFRKINLKEMLADFAERIAGAANKENINIKVETGNEDIFVKASEALMSQSVMNVFSNAIRYAQSEVILELSQDRNCAVIKISDDGDGINPKDMPYIFDRFYKGEKGEHGLGLAIAKSAVNSMNGLITAENGEKGAIFKIIIPI